MAMDFVNTHFKVISAALGLVIVVLLAIIFSGMQPASKSADTATLPTSQGEQAASISKTEEPTGEAKLGEGVLNGSWTSSADTKLVRTFNPDGTVTDTVIGTAKVTQKGTYAVVNPSTVTGAQVPAESLVGQIILKITFPKTGVTYYTVNSMTTTAFEVTDVSVLSGKNITFTRVQ